MFVCEDCGRVFEEPRQSEECQGECHGFPIAEYYSVCPYCFGGDYMEEVENQ